MNEICYVGIDVAMEGFEAAVRPGRKTSKFAYTAAGVRKLLRQLAALTVALVCMEATYTLSELYPPGRDWFARYRSRRGESQVSRPGAARGYLRRRAPPPDLRPGRSGRDVTPRGEFAP